MLSFVLRGSLGILIAIYIFYPREVSNWANDTLIPRLTKNGFFAPCPPRLLWQAGDCKFLCVRVCSHSPTP
jgi:hypothetical protein